VRRRGRSYAHPLVVLIALPNNEGEVRIGVSAGRSVGNAVWRNRAKRRIRAIVAPLLPNLKSGWDVVFLARRPISSATHLELAQAIYQLFQRAHLLSKPQSHVLA